METNCIQRKSNRKIDLFSIYPAIPYSRAGELIQSQTVKSTLQAFVLVRVWNLKNMAAQTTQAPSAELPRHKENVITAKHGERETTAHSFNKNNATVATAAQKWRESRRRRASGHDLWLSNYASESRVSN